MTPDPDEAPSERDEYIATILAEFFQAREAGRNPDPAALIRDHPEIAAELRSFLAGEALVEAAAPLAPLGPGSVIGGYVIDGVRSRRDSGDVYRGRRIADGFAVAIKVYSAFALLPDSDRARFRREAEALGELDHPGIVPLIEAGQTSGVPYLVMPYIDGIDLSDAFKRLSAADDAPTPVVTADRRESPEFLDRNDTKARARAVALLGAQAARALGHAHDRGIVHRDVKPSNLLLRSDGRLFLTDFGLVLKQGLPDLSRTGEIPGSPPYMGPERQGPWCDPRSDVYSLGITLLELLILRRAFPNTQSLVDLIKAIERGPKAPRSFDAAIPADLETIILVAIQHDPADRYASADALADDLERFLDGRPIKARRPGLIRRLTTWSRRHKFEAASLLTLVALLCGMLRFAYLQWVEHEFQTRLYAIQRIRSIEHFEGWSERAWKYVEEAAWFRRDDRLRDEAAATLIGMDVKEEYKHFGIGGSGLAFDRSDRLALIGGSRPSPRAEGRAVILDMQTKRVVARSDLIGPGPVAFTPEDKPLQLLDEGDKGIVLWNVRENQEVARLSLPPSPQPRLLALSPDGRYLAAADREVVTILDRESPAGPRVLKSSGPVTALEFSTEGNWLALGHEQGEIRVESLTPNRPPVIIKGRGYKVQAFAFQEDRVLDGVNPPGQLLAAGDFGGTIFIYEIPSGTIRSKCLGSPHEVTALAFSPDGMTLASAGRENMGLWEHAKGKRSLRLPRGEGAGRIVFARNREAFGYSVIDQYSGESFSVCSISPDRAISRLAGLTSAIMGVVFAPGNSRVAAFSHDWSVGIWDLKPTRLVAVLRSPAGYYADNHALAFGGDGRLLAICVGREAQLWDIRAKKVVRRWTELPPGLVDRLRFPDSEHLILLRVESVDPEVSPLSDRFSSVPKVVRIRNLLAPPSKTLIREVRGYDTVREACLTPDGKHAAIQGVLNDPKFESQSVRMMEIESGRTSWSGEIRIDGKPIGGLAVDSTGTRIAYASKEKVDVACRIADSSDGRVIGTLPTMLHCVGQNAGMWAAIQPAALIDQSITLIALFQGEPSTPILRLSIDGGAIDISPEFAPRDEYFAWGQTDGVALCCDLSEANFRLSTLGLGWLAK